MARAAHSFLQSWGIPAERRVNIGYLFAELGRGSPPQLVVGSERGERALVYWVVVKGGPWLGVHILVEVINFILIRTSTINSHDKLKLQFFQDKTFLCTLVNSYQ